MLHAAWLMREISFVLSDLPLEVSTPDTAEDAPIQRVIRGNYYVDGSGTDASDHEYILLDENFLDFCDFEKEQIELTKQKMRKTRNKYRVYNKWPFSSDDEDAAIHTEETIIPLMRNFHDWYEKDIIIYRT